MDYCGKYWALIYDQFNHGRHEKELEFYLAQARDCQGPVLEVACGTGMILLPMLRRGIDAHGFDISGDMLGTLLSKAQAEGIPDIENRVQQMDMVDFHYDVRFDAVFIPARSFLHLIEQERQIACLRNVRDHLADGGKLALNFFNPSLRSLANSTTEPEEFTSQGTYVDPSDGGRIDLSFKEVSDLANQVRHVTWRFDVRGSEHLTEMGIRWIYMEEFKLLLRLAGFARWKLYGDFDKSEFTAQSDEMVWVAWK
ncbi:MAG: class I SAM-dependent methyltransferase [Armatimonadetes bacterium]|nr:class I SAM-dependent methyltransferase [Armatimonadota bacterium]